MEQQQSTLHIQHTPNQSIRSTESTRTRTPGMASSPATTLYFTRMRRPLSQHMLTFQWHSTARRRKKVGTLLSDPTGLRTAVGLVATLPTEWHNMKIWLPGSRLQGQSRLLIMILQVCILANSYISLLTKDRLLSSNTSTHTICSPCKGRTHASSIHWQL